MPDFSFFSHLTNCHGELTTAALFLTSLPFVGPFLATAFKRKCAHKHDAACSDKK